MSGTLAGLLVDGLSVRYGGVQALDSLSLAAPPGQITGLIGPNGAGKTSAFNALSGIVRPQAGRVWLNGVDISHRPPSARARRGLGRTFQQMELFDSLTVAENVALGHEAALAGRMPFRHLRASRIERARTAEAVDAAMARCGLKDLASANAGTLPTGQRRMLELARLVAGGFQVLLLDEPSSGLGGAESAELGEILRGLAADGRAVLLVEHDMALVMNVCDRISVIDFGQLIFEGGAPEVATSDAVRAAYLGSTALEAV